MESRLLHERLEGPVDPAAVFGALFADLPYAFWLDRGSSGISVMGAGDCVVTAAVASGTLTRTDARGSVTDVRNESVFEFLREQRSAGVGQGASLATGWIGWLGYEVGMRALGLPVATSPYPDAALVHADRTVAFDPHSGTVTVTAHDTGDAWQWMAATIQTLREIRSQPPRVAPGLPEPVDEVDPRDGQTGTWRHSDTEYLAMVQACQDAIVRGDAYVLCLTNELRIPLRVDAVAAYVALRTANPTAHGGLVRVGNLWLVSASPEQFLRITPDGVVTTRPVKGTRPRGADAADDERLRCELASSEKERAENLMIVDLMRNDLSRVARLGTVEVSRLLDVESYAAVHQLVSTVRARLAAGFDSIDAVESCFPAGSMTGTPKRSAMRILDQLESGPRGIYSGCFGLFSDDGSVDVSMVIRSMVVDGSGVSIGAGGGITSMSVPEEELAEVKLKAHLVAAVARASAIH